MSNADSFVNLLTPEQENLKCAKFQVPFLKSQVQRATFEFQTRSSRRDQRFVNSRTSITIATRFAGRVLPSPSRQAQVNGPEAQPYGQVKVLKPRRGRELQCIALGLQLAERRTDKQADSGGGVAMAWSKALAHFGLSSRFQLLLPNSGTLPSTQKLPNRKGWSSRQACPLGFCPAALP